MSVYNDIRVALERHLSDTMLYAQWDEGAGAWNDAAPTVPPASDLLDIAWPGVPFAPLTGRSYLRVQFAPTARRPTVIGPDPEQRVQGLLFVDVFSPENRGALAGTSLADLIVRRFNGSSAIIAPNAVVRLEYSEARLPLHDPPFFVIPVEISWYSFKP